jgi:hypothetical protein
MYRKYIDYEIERKIDILKYFVIINTMSLLPHKDVPAIHIGEKCIGIIQYSNPSLSSQSFGILDYTLKEEDDERTEEYHVVLTICGINALALQLLNPEITFEAQVMNVMAVNESDSLIPEYFQGIRCQLINILSRGVMKDSLH